MTRQVEIRKPTNLDPWLWVICPEMMASQFKKWGPAGVASAANHGHARATRCIDCIHRISFTVTKQGADALECGYKERDV